MASTKGEPGTLAGLIEDLEEAIRRQYSEEDERHDLLTKVTAAVDRHKRAQYVIEPALYSRRKREHLPPGTYSIYTGEPPGKRHYIGTKAECEAWVERQVNG
jgi:hypothetical protein